MAYNRTYWENGQPPAIDAEKLNKIEEAIDHLDKTVVKSALMYISYTGTGNYGEASTLKITFPYEPKIVIIQAIATSDGSIGRDGYSDANGLVGGAILTKDVKKIQYVVGTGTYSYPFATVTWGTTITISADRGPLLNVKNYTYYCTGLV